MSKKILFSYEAKEDLIKIKNYIESDLENPLAADNVIRGILDCAKQLEIFPESGSKLNEKIKAETDYRYLISGNYMIFYTIDSDLIRISRIIYGKRDYPQLLL